MITEKEKCFIVTEINVTNYLENGYDFKILGWPKLSFGFFTKNPKHFELTMHTLIDHRCIKTGFRRTVNMPMDLPITQ